MRDACLSPGVEGLALTVADREYSWRAVTLEAACNDCGGEDRTCFCGMIFPGVAQSLQHWRF